LAAHTSYLLQSLAWCVAIFLVLAPSRYGATAAACDRTVSDPMLLTVHGEGSLSVQMPIGGRKRRPEPEGWAALFPEMQRRRAHPPLTPTATHPSS
jgi:hypothetical protein